MSTDVNTIVTIISIIVTIYFGIGKYNAKKELNKMRKYLDLKRMEEFSVRYRDELRTYSNKIGRPKWKETIRGKDVVGSIDAILTEFNTHLPKMDVENRRRLVAAIDEAKKEFAKVRKGDESIRDINLQHLNAIDRILNEETESQRKEFVDLI